MPVVSTYSSALLDTKYASTLNTLHTSHGLEYGIERAVHEHGFPHVGAGRYDGWWLPICVLRSAVKVRALSNKLNHAERRESDDPLR